MTECLFCGGSVKPTGECEGCRFHWLVTPDGLKFHKEDTQAAFSEPRQSPWNFRDHLTIRIREVLSDYATGRKDIPHERARHLVGLLLDLHCHLEGVVIGMSSWIAAMERPRYVPFYPSPRPPKDYFPPRRRTM